MLVVRVGVENVIEVEVVLLDILCQVDLQPETITHNEEPVTNLS